MSFSPEKNSHYEALCRGFRRDLIETLYPIQTGHPGGSLSCVEILTALYFDTFAIIAQFSERKKSQKCFT